MGKLAPLVYHLTGLLLHIANTWILYAICLEWPRLRAAAPWAAGFFAVAEGHQEAVIWFSAINELLQFLFGMGALWCWLRLRARGPSGGRNWRGIGLFALALVSKESAVAILPLFLLADGWREWRRTAVRLVPYMVLAAVAVAGVVDSRDISFRFSDGSFSLHATVLDHVAGQFLRVLVDLGLRGGWRHPAGARPQAARNPRSWLWRGSGSAWLPYSFLLYSSRIPSRQTYLASAGLAMLFGLAMAHWQARAGARRMAWWRRWPPRWCCTTWAIFGPGKRAQFLERAAPTEQLIAVARRTPGPIWVRCFPRNRFIAEEAAHLGAGYAPSDLVWDEAEAKRRQVAAVFCYRASSPTPP